MLLSTIAILACMDLLTTADGQRSRYFASANPEAMMKSDMAAIPIRTIAVQGVGGQTATLPCDIQPQESNDSVTMVLWFKDSTREPVYSYDARNLHLGKVKYWSAEHFWGNRATFRTKPSGELVIKDVREGDAGEFRCRVDFRNSPSKNQKVNFTIIVPASKPIIYDTKERDMSKHAEAYPEGSDLELICEVRGGKPIPKVSWFLESQLINSTSEIRQVQSQNSVPYHSSMSTSSLSSSSSSSSSSLSSSSSSSSSSASLQPSTLSSSTRDSTKFKLSTTLIISRVTIKNLKRSHHHAKVSCRANNTPLAAPQTTTITISLYMKPLEVKIINKTQFVSSSRRYQTECKSSGSRPEATLTWYKGSKTLKNLSKDFHKDGMSVSILEWQPDAEDEGKYLTCRAENRHLPDAVIEDKWKLKVHFAPIVQLRVGSSLDLKGIKEGDDVTFECNVRSVPRNFKLSWFHGNKELRHNASTGVVLSDQSLVLQGISREAAGNYSCVATNSEGRNRSNLVPLRVMYAPTCKQLRPLEPHEIDEDDEEEERDEEEEAEENMNALMDFENEDEQEEERSRRRSRRKRLLKLLCAIEANPRSVQFYWTFNNTILEPAQNLPDKRFRSEGLVSRLSHALETEQDYGTFSCWASNEIGQSKQPCVYHVPEPMKPEALQNCTARNQSGAWIRISCYEGADGGLPQHFVASVDELSWESDTPEWRLELRKPSSRVVLFAVNARGTSEPVVLEGIVYRDVAKFTGETGLPLDISPILIGLGGTATGLGLIVTGVLMALWRKHAAMGGSGTGGSGSSPSKPKALQQQHQQHQQHLHQPPSIATFAVKGVEEEDGNPDLIPTTALTNNYADRKLSVYGSLPRRTMWGDDPHMPPRVLQDIDYPRAAPNTYHSLQRPTRYTADAIVRHATVQESCI